MLVVEQKDVQRQRDVEQSQGIARLGGESTPLIDNAIPLDRTTRPVANPMSNRKSPASR